MKTKIGPAGCRHVDAPGVGLYKVVGILAEGNFP
jgi:hypothetical protein